MSVNQPVSPHRKTVLKVIEKNPSITIGMIAGLTGLSYDSVKHHVEQLLKTGAIHLAELSPGMIGAKWSRKGYRAGAVQVVAPAAIPKHWDVLAHFFGRIAAEPAAA